MAMCLAIYSNPSSIPSPEAPEPRPDPSAAALAAESHKAKALAVSIQELEEQLRRAARRASRFEDAWMKAQARQEADFQAKLAVFRLRVNECGVGQLFSKAALDWRRKYEDLSILYQLAQENPAHEMKGRPRWAPVNAQAAVLNDWWRKQFASLEARARQATEAKDAEINHSNGQEMEFEHQSTADGGAARADGNEPDEAEETEEQKAPSPGSYG
ncbi:uncharacterized protein N7515_004562 [Penicillium bovifimosum]|uniref:Uncharacterized protein n=1 Tax=Penicillium bovifimosum TaxID=126998 RepID=A0A9W9L443_9EURO|nr:uncharacterized protein N7515_004562 [Penicillium bovifimosum]KAJ5135284.1 hypothetical protein N7515_004562 [Penicillium bovifimosum]